MGGGIYNSGTVLIGDSTISSNYAKGDGGGILNYNGANLMVRNSTISSNDSKIGLGGGIYNSGNTLEVSNSTISNNSANAGGGISNSGNTVDVNNSTISGNGVGFGVGGGIDNGGTMNVSNSTISGNSIGKYGGGGGGIDNGGTMNVSNSTISDNSLLGGASALSLPQGNGGGIDNNGTMTVSNSTICGNSATYEGGGIFNSGALSLVFSTLTLNKALDGGGVFNSPGSNFYRPGSISARNTIIAANLTTEDGVNPDVSGTYTSIGYNLIGDSTGSTGFGNLGDIVGTSDNPIDPRLDPLDFYGGPTQTIALLPDSPAIDAADPITLDTDPTTDQRGFPRVVNGRADIGAFEFSLV